MPDDKRSLDEIATEVKRLMGVTDDSPRSRAWRIIRNSQRDCSCCAKCGKAIAPGETVWRMTVNVGGSCSQNYLLALCSEQCCDDCLTPDFKHSSMSAFLYGVRDPRYRFVQQECAGCGRTVHAEVKLQWSDATDSYERKAVTCCEQCAHNVRLARARRKRTEARGTSECQHCGETFEPTRTDSKFCSGLCRQKAYRNRVTVDAPVLRHPRKSRNGKRP